MEGNGAMFPPTPAASHWARGGHAQPTAGSAGSSRSSTPAVHMQQQQQQQQSLSQSYGQSYGSATSGSLPHYAFPGPSSPFRPTSSLGFDGQGQQTAGGFANLFMKQQLPQQQQHQQQHPNGGNLGLALAGGAGGLGPREPRAGLPSYAFPPATSLAMPPPQSPYLQMQSPVGGGFDFVQQQQQQQQQNGFQLPSSFDGLGQVEGNDTLAMAIRLGMSIGMSMNANGGHGEMASPAGSAASPSFRHGSQSVGALSPTGEPQHPWALPAGSAGSSAAPSPMNPASSYGRGRGLHFGRDPTGRTAPIPLPSSASSGLAHSSSATPSPGLAARSVDKSAGFQGAAAAGKHARQPSRTVESAVPSPSASTSVAVSPSVTDTPGLQHASPVGAGYDDGADDHPTTKVWKLYAKQKSDPTGPRMENLTWRMMAMSLKREELAQLEAGLGPLSEEDERFLKELRESKNEEADQFDTGLQTDLDTQTALEQLLSPTHGSLASLSASHVSSLSRHSRPSQSSASSERRTKEEEPRGRGRRPTAKVVGFDAGFTGANECVPTPPRL
jgi:hypothetical protein